MRERSVREPPAKEMGMSLRKNGTFQTGTARLRVRRLRILEKGSLTFPCRRPFVRQRKPPSVCPAAVRSRKEDGPFPAAGPFSPPNTRL
ncbi:MAG: hypothetical protein CW346_00765 [Bacillaceae bacterium]|nr:hypothetical protein [Bacillaceae bacterium]